jgi:hypothetical protein
MELAQRVSKRFNFIDQMGSAINGLELINNGSFFFMTNFLPGFTLETTESLSMGEEG